MSMKTYSGSCHCGAVRFQAELDFAEGTVKCNCTSCTKARSWLILTPASRFRVVQGEDSQAEYQWTPPGRPNPTVQFHFCKRCGIRTPGRGELEAMGRNPAEGIPAAEVAKITVRQFRDGPTGSVVPAAKI